MEEKNDNTVNFVTRQQKRLEERENAKNMEKYQKWLNAPATNRDLELTKMSIKDISEKLYAMDIYVSAVDRIIRRKNICMDNEIQEAVEFESQRAGMFKEVQNTPKDYIERLEKCLKWELPIEKTNIAGQIIQDTEMTNEEKITIAEKYDLKPVLASIKKDERMEEKVNEIAAEINQ